MFRLGSYRARKCIQQIFTQQYIVDESPAGGNMQVQPVETGSLGGT